MDGITPVNPWAKTVPHPDAPTEAVWRAAGTPCPLPDVPEASSVSCTGCIFWRGTSGRTPPILLCNWPRVGAWRDTNPPYYEGRPPMPEVPDVFRR